MSLQRVNRLIRNRLVPVWSVWPVWLMCALLMGSPVIGLAQVVVSAPNFASAQSGRIWMDIGGVWNGTAVVAKDNGTAVLDGDEFSFDYTNGAATQFEFKPQIAFPAGVFIPATGTKGARIDTIGAGCPVGMAVSNLTNAAGLITLNLIPAAGLGGFDLPPGCSFTLRINGLIAKTAPAATITLQANALSATVDGSATSMVLGATKGALVRSGFTTLNKTPNNQSRAKGATAAWPNGLMVVNTGLGGLFDVTLNEGDIAPGGGLSLIALTAPGAACAASVCTQAYLAPAASLLGSAQATVTSCQNILNTLRTNDLTGVTNKSTAAQVTLDLQQPLLNYTPPSFTIPFGGSVNASLTVSNTSPGAAQATAGGGILLTTNYPALGVNISNVSAGWTYNAGVFRYNSPIPGITGSVPLSFTASENNSCSFAGGVVQWRTAYTDDCGNAFNVPTQISTVTKDTVVPNVLLSKSASVGYRQIVNTPGSYTITSTGVNSAGLVGTTISITDVLPTGIVIGAITASAGTFSCAGPCVAGSTLTWTYPKSNTAQTLTINYTAPSNVCSAGTTMNNTASYVGATTAPSSCPVAASSSAGVLLTLPAGTGVAQNYNVLSGPSALFEAGLTDTNNNGVADKPAPSLLNEGDQIPVTADYSFGSATVGTWAGSVHSDNFGGLPAGAARLAASTLKVQIDTGSGAFGPLIAVPGGSVACATGTLVANTCGTNMAINLAFLNGAGFFNTVNVASATAGLIRRVRFSYSLTINDSVLPAPAQGVSQRQITQLGKLTLAGASSGCLSNEFTQGDIYLLGRAAARASIALPTVLDVCQPIDAPITLSNPTPAFWLNNLSTTLNTTATSNWRYVAGQTPTYSGLYPSTVPVTYSANAGVSPNWANTNPAQRFNATATITPKVFIAASQPANVLPSALTVQVDYDDNQTAGGARNFVGATGTAASANIAVIRKADIVATVSPQTVNVIGSSVQWRVFITNTGSGAAYGASFTDTLPGALTPNAAATNAANAASSCAPISNPCLVTVTGQTVTFGLGDIPAGATRAVDIVATVNTSSPTCPSIAAGQFSSRWGCGVPFEAAQTLSPARPTFVFPQGQLTVQHDTAATSCVLCGTGQTVLRLRNTGATNVFNMALTEVLNPAPQGVALVGNGEYSTNNGLSWTPIGTAPTLLNAATSQYQWSSAQVPALAQLWPLSLSNATQPNEVLIRLTFSTNNLTASVVNPQFIAQTTGIVACGNLVDTGVQAFNLSVQKPVIGVAKTATNRSAQNPTLGMAGAAGVGTYTESVFGGAGDVVEWRVVVTNTGNAAALNLRFGDVFANTGGTQQAIVAGPVCAGVSYPIALVNNVATNNLCNLPNTAGSNTHTYYIRETLGNTNACASATNTADVSYGCSAGGAAGNRSGIVGGSDTATVIRAPNFAAFSAAGSQTLFQEAGGRMRIEVTMTNVGGTAQSLSLANPLPAGWKIDPTFTPKVYGSGVTAACTAPPTASGAAYNCSCVGTACLSHTTSIAGTSTSPIINLTGQMRNAAQALVVYYILPTNYDTTTASSFPALAANETGALDPTPLQPANNPITLSVLNTCSATNTVVNNSALNSVQPDLDIYLFNAANTSTNANRIVRSGAPETFHFRVRNVGEAGSFVAASDFTVQLGNGWRAPTVQVIGVAGSGYTGAAVPCTALGGGSYRCTQPAGSTLNVNQDYTVQVQATPIYSPGVSLEVSGVVRGFEAVAAGVASAMTSLHSLDKAQYRVIGADLSKARLANSTSESATTEPAPPAVADMLIGEQVSWALSARLWGMGAEPATAVTFRDTYANLSGAPPPQHNGFGFVGQADAGSTIAGLTFVPPAAAVAPMTIPALAPSRVDYTAASISGEGLFAKTVTTRVVNHSSVQNNTVLRNNFGLQFTYGGQRFHSSNTSDGFSGGVALAALHKDADVRAIVPNVSLSKQVCNTNITTCNIATGAGFSNATSGDASHQFIYRIVISNSGLAPAFDVGVQDVLQSPKLLMVSGASDGLDNDQNGAIDGAQSEGAFTPGAAGSVLFNSGNVSAPTSAKLVKLDPGVSQILIYRVDANPSTVLGGDLLSNLATLTYSTLPGSFGNQTVANRGPGSPPPASGLNGTGERVFTSTASATILFSRVYGRVYLDQNHNSSYEPADGNYVGTTVTTAPTPFLCAQLISQPAGTLSNSQVLSATGTYSFATAPAGNYDVRIVLASSALTCPAAIAPPWNPAAFGYIPTEADTQSRNFTVSASLGAQGQNFGLFRGTKVSGKVFLDNNGASANDGVFNAADTGIHGVPVCASLSAVANCSVAPVIEQTTTDPAGNYTLWVPLSSQQSVFVTNAGTGRLSTGASIGSVALPNATVTNVAGLAYTYTYVVEVDRIQFSASPGNAYGTLNFGEILPSIFTTDDARTVPAGSTTLYAHSFTASTAGAVNFTTNAISAPAGPWTEQLYLDLNCNGQIDSSDTPITAPISVIAAQTLCIIHKENVPSGSPAGAINTVTVSAVLTASNNALIPVQALTRTDITTVTAAASGALTLLKEVCNATVTPACPSYTTQNTGKAGDWLRYRITYTNTGTSAINNVVVQDSTPPYTTFQLADAGALPNSLSACNKTTPSGTVACNTVQTAGGTGAVKWVFTGPLLSGQSGVVGFVVQVQP